jgi:DMSO reductase anchor subunit
MYPAYSVILFTTASGAGYGLLLLIGLAAPAGLLPGNGWFAFIASALSLGLISVGLLSATFHLGHPERAWRALTQWRSSWLSREGIAAVATFFPAGLFAVGWIWTGTLGVFWPWLGVAAAAGAVATVVCTAMIYRTLKAIPRWHNQLVTPVYLVLALLTGAAWLNGLAAAFGIPGNWTALLTAAAAALGWALKGAYWRDIDNAAPVSTAETATGLGQIGKVRLLEAPHVVDNYLLQEMGYRVARKHAVKLRRLASIFGFAAPILLVGFQLLLPGPIAVVASALAAFSASLGVVIERWLFFAEAQHAVTLYYGEGAV